MRDSFKTRTALAVGAKSYEIYSLPALQGHDSGRLPFSLKILLENLLRFEDGVNVTREDIEALLNWNAKAAPSYEIAFTPSFASEKTTRARCSMLTWCTIPVLGGTTRKLLNAVWPQRRNE